MLPAQSPYMAHIDITKLCNSRCKFCITSSPKQKDIGLTKAELFKLIDNLAMSGVYYLRILGGEPFTRPDLLDVLEHASRRGVFILMSSNGTLISAENVLRLKELGHYLYYFQISMYGADSQAYEETCGNGELFYQMSKGIELCVANDIHPTILTCVTRQTIDRLDEMYDFIEEKGLNVFRLVTLANLGNAREHYSSMHVSRSEFYSALAKINNYAKGRTVKVQTTSYLAEAVAMSKKLNVQSVVLKCRAALGEIYFDQTGKASPCPFLEHGKSLPSDCSVLKSSHQFNISSIWKSPQFDAFRVLHNNNLSTCSKCKYLKNGICVPCPLGTACLNRAKHIPKVKMI